MAWWGGARERPAGCPSRPVAEARRHGGARRRGGLRRRTPVGERAVFSTAAALSIDTTAATATAGEELTDIISAATESVVSVDTVSYAGPFGGEAAGSGSGVVVRSDGIVVTNAHVVAGATAISVTTSDGMRREASVVGSDPEHDIALLKVGAEDLTPITIGSSDALQLGDDVVALGHPLGLGTTATRGIVSGLDRTIRVGDGAFGSSELRGLLQTDAAINPGNSGGALVDSEGRLVGINTAAASASSAENVGFAVAIDEALPVVERLLEGAA
ncbi:MAG TPA: trypsin-like peptidase domain-containing protein [Actinomycetota bacterium]|nr:trypsin-like peptidase domain-containing protein [Actinomycetota bacterium]